MTTQTQIKTKPRSPSEVSVSPVTEYTDFHGVLQLFGLRRSTANHLANEGFIRSISLAEGGEKRGKRLFHCESIRTYLDSKLPVHAKNGGK